MKREDILAVYEAGTEKVIELVTMLLEEIAILKERVLVLEERLNMNSKNSNKSPGRDEFVKPKSRRLKSGKNRGGQKGHRGYTLFTRINLKKDTKR